MILEDFGCLLTDNLRSRAYLQKLVRNSFIPRLIVSVEFTEKTKENPCTEIVSTEDLIDRTFIGRKYFLYDVKLKKNSLLNGALSSRSDSFDTTEPIMETIRKNGLKHRAVKVLSINDESVIDVLRGSAPTYFLFGGGGILREPILNIGKRFIHIHPGMVPHFRGSHCIEWSVLLHDRCGATAFFMNTGIDGGDIIAREEFEFPRLENGSLPPAYSSHIRSELLVKIIRDYARTGKFDRCKQDLSKGETYYKMHPALTNLVFHRLVRRAQ